MKKFASFGIIAMLLFVSLSLIINIYSAPSLPTEGEPLENLEEALSENIPFREELTDLMDTVRYVSGVRHFGDIYIGSEGSLLQDITEPSSRIFSLTKNYVLAFGEKHQLKPYFMLVPTAPVILQQELDTYAREDIYNQRNMINRMYSEFSGAVRTTDIYQTLYNHRGEYIYYHTENLPTSLGGYYIYTELCSRLGIEQNSLDKFSAAYAAHGFYGSLADAFFKPYAKADFMSLYEYIGENKEFVIEHFGSKGSTKITENIFVYDEHRFSDKTDMVFGGLSPKMEITAAKTYGEGSSLLVFGDESAKSWLPFIVSNYSKITFIDLNTCSSRHLSGIAPEEYTHVLFAYSTATFAKGISFEMLENIG